MLPRLITVANGTGTIASDAFVVFKGPDLSERVFLMALKRTSRKAILVCGCVRADQAPGLRSESIETAPIDPGRIGWRPALSSAALRNELSCDSFCAEQVF